MAPGKRQVKARRHLVYNHCHSLVDFAVSWCGKSWSETTEEGFTFQCLGCWKVDCLTAELARLTDIVKGMQSGGRVIARTTNGERTTGNMTCRKVAGEKVTVVKEGGKRGTGDERSRWTGGKTNGRKEVRGDVTKGKVNNKDDDRKKKARKKRGTTEKAAGGKVRGDGKRRSYSEAVIEGALRKERSPSPVKSPSLDALPRLVPFSSVVALSRLVTLSRLVALSLVAALSRLVALYRLVALSLLVVLS
ncbi:hypothetical protein NP493_2923g00001 [Ridgeia piscesae]|uniref:Uncharacterized protein n=1 Tax=Ridgeia piscesae TaxID=27915 RepID=A0AAD9MZD2_RIDPI|nr:hypothetical protein NP493_2923g00001 [Ridgeia piscesae]